MSIIIHKTKNTKIQKHQESFYKNQNIKIGIKIESEIYIQHYGNFKNTKTSRKNRPLSNHCLSMVRSKPNRNKNTTKPEIKISKPTHFLATLLSLYNLTKITQLFIVTLLKLNLSETNH